MGVDMRKFGIGVVVVLVVAIIVYKMQPLTKKIEINFWVYQKLGWKWEGWVNQGIEKINDKEYRLIYRSSDYDVDGIYKSMFGPASIHYLTIDDTKEELLWMTRLSAEVIDVASSEELSGDFLCHLNMDYHVPEHFGRWGMSGKIQDDYTRFVTLSSGFQQLSLPEGFGFPIYSNDKLTFDSQVLNLNIASPKELRVAHKVELTFEKDSPKNRKIPLTPRPVLIYRPFNGEVPHIEMEGVANSCIPVDPRQHSYVENGTSLTGHWIMPPGRDTTRFDVTEQLGLNAAERVHYAVAHIHPYCESFELYDKTNDTTLIALDMVNFDDKIGLKEIDIYNSEVGVELLPNTSYELILHVNNTSGEDQDMMALMMLFVRDIELESSINNYLR